MPAGWCVCGWRVAGWSRVEPAGNNEAAGTKALGANPVEAAGRPRPLEADSVPAQPSSDRIPNSSEAAKAHKTSELAGYPNHLNVLAPELKSGTRRHQTPKA